MNWCILIPLLVGLICALLGYLLGRLFGGGNDQSDLIAKLEADLEACKRSRMSLETDLQSVKADLASSLAVATLIPFDASAAKAVFGKKIKENDLTIIEGIGPKIEELFKTHGVATWKALSECTLDKCQSILDSGGERFRVHKPNTWPEQAKMAYEGKWAELLKWQDELDGGK